MTSSTMVLVFFTTVFFGAMMPRMVKYFKRNEKSPIEEINENKSNNLYSLNDSDGSLERYSLSNYDVNNGRKKSDPSVDLNVSQKISKKINGLWRRFDNYVMKPFFIGDWPYVKEDHDLLSQKIISVFDEHQKRKYKNKEMANIIASDPKKEEKIESLLYKVKK